MLVFIDESYQPNSEGKWNYALAGFGINEFRYRALQAAVYQLCQTFFDSRDNYIDGEVVSARQSKIVVNGDIEGVELKASELLKPGTLRRYGGQTSPQVRFIEEVLKKVQDCRGTVVGVLLEPDTPDSVKDVSLGCPRPYVKLLDVVAKWMDEEYPGQSVSLVMDTEHRGINMPLTRAISKYLYRSSAGKRMKHVFPSPFWIDSQSMIGAQVADIIAHILMDGMKEPSARKPIDNLRSSVDALAHRWNGGDGRTILKLRG